MKIDKLAAGAAAFALGSLLLIGAGCVPASSASERPGAAAPAGATADSAGAREITVTATDFAFTPSEIRVKKGEKIKLTLTNADGGHGIAIPAFGVNLRARPGGSASVVFTADRTGSFPFFCDVFCGEGHGAMRGTLVVE